MGAINQRLRSYLDQNGIVHEWLASELGATKSQMSNWLTDTKIPLGILTRIFKKYEDIDVRWLFTGEPTFPDVKPNYIEMVQSSEPIPPYDAKCKNPICKLKIESLEREIQLLENNLSDLRRKEVCSMGEIEGGLEKPGKTG